MNVERASLSGNGACAMTFSYSSHSHREDITAMEPVGPQYENQDTGKHHKLPVLPVASLGSS